MKEALFALTLAVAACQSATTQPPQEKPPVAPASLPIPTPVITPFPAQLASLMGLLLADDWAMSIVVGVVTKEKSEVFAFGRLSAADARKPDEHTLYEIGSLTKVFTTTLLADMVIKKEVALTDPIETYLPAGVAAPTRGAAEITLLDLATHTSGLPVVSDNFWPNPTDSRYDPNFAGQGWSAFTEEKFYEYLQAPAPAIGPKKQYLYSNLGLGLLGHLLEKKAGKGYEALLIERILSPLQMRDTRITLSDEQGARLAPGHDADNTPTNPWTDSALRGAFALRASMHDLLLFVQANLGLLKSPLDEAIKLAHKEQFKKSQWESVGLGWNLNQYGVVFHTGTTGGYRSVLFMLPAKQMGIVVLTNTLVGGSTDGRAAFFDTMGGSVLNLLVGVAPIPVEIPKVGATPAQPADYVGSYGYTADAPMLRVSLEGDKLSALITGRVANRMYPEAKDTFFMKAYDARFVFTRDSSGAVTGMEGTLAGKKAKFTRFQP